MPENEPERRREAEEELVALVGPADQKDVTYLTEAGPIRFVEGRARVPLSVARKLARAPRPGWLIEPRPLLKVKG